MRAGQAASYTAPRYDVAALIPIRARRILELGCSTGATADLVIARQPCVYEGIEYDPELADAASNVVARVYARDLNEPDCFRDIEAGIDCIVAADVLEHLVDPWSTLRAAARLLSPDGCVVLSLPNARHLQTILNLLRGRWPYRERGVHDATHLRFFTFREMRALLGVAGLHIERVIRNQRLGDLAGPLDRLVPAMNVIGLRDFTTYQYLLRAVPVGQCQPVPADAVPPWHVDRGSRDATGPC